MTGAPVPSAPAAPAAAGTTPAGEAPAAPKSLTQVLLDQKNIRGKPSKGSGGFVKGPNGPLKPAAVAPSMAKPEAAAAKAGAPVQKSSQPENVPAPEAKADAPLPPAEKSAPDPMAELKKGFDAKSRELADLRKQFSTLESMAKGDFKSLVMKLAEHYQADPQKVAEQLLMERAEKWAEEQKLAEMSPEQREYYELKRDAEARKVSEAKAAEAAKAEAATAAQRAIYESTTNVLIEAHKLLPEAIRNHPDFNGRAALRVRDQLRAMAEVADPEMPVEEFLKGINPAELAKAAWDDHRAELKNAMLAMGDEDLDAFLDPKLAERWTRKLQGAARAKAHPSLTAQPRTVEGKFTAGSTKPDPKPLSAMKPAWGSFLPKKR